MGQIQHLNLITGLKIHYQQKQKRMLTASFFLAIDVVKVLTSKK